MITYPHPTYNPDRPSEIQNCYGGGKYCARANSGFISQYNEEAIIQENILQKCIFKYAFEVAKQRELYFNYMIAFNNNCIKSEEKRFTPECGKAAMIEQGIPTDKINECYYDSFDFKSEDREKNLASIKLLSNKILDADVQDRNDLYLKYIPSILINGQVFWGKWHTNNVLEALCAGIKKKPEMCYVEGGFVHVNNDSSMKVVWIIIVLLLVINLVVFILCRKYMKKKISERVEESELDQKVNSVVTSYLALKEKN